MFQTVITGGQPSLVVKSHGRGGQWLGGTFMSLPAYIPTIAIGLAPTRTQIIPKSEEFLQELPQIPTISGDICHPIPKDV